MTTPLKGNPCSIFGISSTTDQYIIYAVNNENYQPSLKGIAMLYTAISVLNGFAFLSTLIVPIWAIFLIGVAGYLAFLDN